MFRGMQNFPMRSSSILLRSVSIILVVGILLDFRQRALGLLNNNPTKESQRASISLAAAKVDVWNNVIDANHLAPLLHNESKRVGLGHKVFSRPTASQNPIEQALDSILTQLHDESKYVEYWTRQEWRSIHAHADVDEYKAKQEQQAGEEMGEFRYPRNGHVLYLQVGSEVKGPTCVFPNRRSGGDLLRKLENVGDEGSETNQEDNIDLITVPAVPGRLLRFQGDYLHAVPRPTDLWLLKFVRGSPTFEPEEEWGRSVILFNTWEDEPPMGLPIDEGQEDDSFEKGNHECNKKEEWSPASSQEGQCHNEEHELSAKIWLLGDYRRRDYQMQTVKVGASESLREALYQKSDVTSTMLKIP